MDKIATNLVTKIAENADNPESLDIIHAAGLVRLDSIPVEVEDEGTTKIGSMFDVLSDEELVKLATPDEQTGLSVIDQLGLNELQDMAGFEQVAEAMLGADLQEKIAADIGGKLRSIMDLAKRFGGGVKGVAGKAMGGARELGSIAGGVGAAYRGARGAGFGPRASLGSAFQEFRGGAGAASLAAKGVAGAGALAMAGIPVAATAAIPEPTPTERARAALGL